MYQSTLTKTDNVVTRAESAIRNVIDTIAEKLASHFQVKDSTMSTTYQEFIELAQAAGFEIGYRNSFNGTGFTGAAEATESEEECILYHPESGTIIYAESIGGDVLNNATVYCEIKIKSVTLSKEQSDAIKRCYQVYNGNHTISISFDGRTGFISKLNQISNAFVFSKKRSAVFFPNFRNYMEANDPVSKTSMINHQKVGHNEALSTILNGMF